VLIFNNPVILKIIVKAGAVLVGAASHRVTAPAPTPFLWARWCKIYKKYTGTFFCGSGTRKEKYAVPVPQRWIQKKILLLLLLSTGILFDIGSYKISGRIFGFRL
jgi:hypothetical protein